MEALKETFAKETGKLVGTKLPGDSGVIFSPNPQNLFSLRVIQAENIGETKV